MWADSWEHIPNLLGLFLQICFEFARPSGKSRHRYKGSLTAVHRKLRTSVDDHDHDEFF
jgi:hypothetical protein